MVDSVTARLFISYPLKLQRTNTHLKYSRSYKTNNRKQEQTRPHRRPPEQSKSMARYYKYVRVTNIEFDDNTIEDFAEEIHRLELGNIFDCAVFRPNDTSRTTTTANIALWNRARHDELTEPTPVSRNRATLPRLPYTRPPR